MDIQVQQLLREGSSLLQSGNPRQALVCFQNAQKIIPPNSILHLHAGAALHDLGSYEEAITSYQHAIAIKPSMGEAHNNLGNALMALGRFAEAADSFLRAAEILAASPVPLTALATALQAIGKVTEAEADCRKALALDHAFAAGHWNLALNLLLQGKYEEGWQEYEWRWKKPDFTSPVRHNDIPLWDGSPLDGRTILLHAEQGFGDAIQFVRYVPMVADCGGDVVLECHPQLVSLFQGIQGETTVAAFGKKLPACDCQAPLLSLPHIFGTTLQNIPSHCPYLSVAAEYNEKWAKLIRGPQNRVKAGVAWAGKRSPDPLRSCQLEELVPLATTHGVTFYSLQIGAESVQAASLASRMQLLDLTSHIHDFSDTAALIEQLDLVITIDTAVAHLAGAMGKPVFLMLPFAPDWRWLLDRSDSPWYPTLQIFRQKQPGDWGEMMSSVQTALELHVTAKIL